MWQLESYNKQEIGGGQVQRMNDVVRLLNPACSQLGYVNAQLDDYAGLPRRRYGWRAGVRLALNGRFSTDTPQGTAGFGFWNAPFGDPNVPIPALPKAIWFFYASAPNQLPFAPPEGGWFVATIDATRWQALATIPLAPLVVLMSQWPQLKTWWWRWLKPKLGVSYQLLTVSLTDWHDYQLEWRANGVSFWVDGNLVHESPFAPRGPLGLVVWIDNQWMQVGINGRFRANTLPLLHPQSLEIRDLQILPQNQH